MDFHGHADRLIAGIDKAMAVAPPSGRRQDVAEQTAPTTNPRPLRKFVIWSAAILLAGAAAPMWFLTAHPWREANGTRQSPGFTSAPLSSEAVMAPPPLTAAQPPSP